MRIERTRDLGIVRAILSHPAIAPHIAEDGVTSDPQEHDTLHWMLITEGDPCGVFLVHATGLHCYEMHTCLLPHIWGAQAKEAARLLVGHVFDVLKARKLITRVPAYNRLALRFAKACGGQIEGNNRASYLHGGVMHDQILLGITDKEWTQCQQQSRQ